MLSTGVPNLDLILGGGIPQGDTLLVVGAAGTGKTTLTMQIACHVAAEGQVALYVSTLSEPPTRIIAHMKGFSFFDQSLIGKHLFFLGTYPALTQDLNVLREQLVREVKEHRAALLVFDGMMTVHDLYPEMPAARTFVYDLGAELAACGTTTILTTSSTARPGGLDYPEVTMADGILNIGMLDIGTQTTRAIRMSKIRGLSPLLGQHSMNISPDGVTVFPRIESLYQPRNIGLGTERVPLGLGELDAMMDGGPLVGSTTMLAGALGTGKTMTALQYVVEGARRGEKGLFVSLRETPAQLMDKAAIFGTDLGRLVDDGLITIVYLPQVDAVADRLTWEIVRHVDDFSPARLALDSLSELEQAAVEDRRRRGYTFALSSTLRQKGVTSLMTKEVAQVVGPELDFSDTPLANLAENLILMRYVEFRGQIYRIISILKMRDSQHDRSIRQYTIGDQGLKVLARVETAEGLLSGIARLPGEVRVRRGGGGSALAEGGFAP